MLVDDDYPVLEWMRETIPWDRLGLEPGGLHDNGLSAWEHAQREMPDILVTDIGMPYMDGLELIEKLKERKPDLKVAILSCHAEFHYARQAMRLAVQDYLLKDTLEADDVRELLAQLKDSLDREREERRSNRPSGWREAESPAPPADRRSRDTLKEKFIRDTVHQPLLSAERWKAEARLFGLETEIAVWLPALCMIDRYREARQRFASGETLRFAVANVLEEAAGDLPVNAVPFVYESRKVFIILSFRPSLKVNPYEQAREAAAVLRDALRRTLGLSVSFLIGDTCDRPEGLKHELAALLASDAQRFYLPAGAIERRRPFQGAQTNLFALYDEARADFREMVLQGGDGWERTPERWIHRLAQERHPPEVVKEWVLKLLLDLRLKFQSLQHFYSARPMETLHHDLFELDSLEELHHWLIGHFRAMMTQADRILRQSRREEILEACRYVETHLDQKIGLEEVASHLHLNSSYFSRLFKKETGETFIEYVTRTKMERAMELLDTTAYPVGKICELVGYDNHSYFIKSFKAFTGMTPAEYRNKGGKA